jgi:hypothetical protein
MDLDRALLDDAFTLGPALFRGFDDHLNKCG